MFTVKEQVKQQTYIIIIIIAKVSDVACTSVQSPIDIKLLIQHS